MTTEQAWDRFARFYDGYIKDFKADLSLYTREAKPHEPVLEVGCGTGRVLKALVEYGHPCKGLDISQTMLGFAKIHLKSWLNGKGLELHRHDLSFSPYKTSSTLGLVTWFTFNYITDHPERFVENLKNSLFLRHRVMIDCFYPRSLQQPETDDTWMDGSIRYQNSHIAYRDRRVFKKNIEHRTQVFLSPEGEETVETKRRYYSPREMEALLRAAGYQDIEFFAGYGGDWVDELSESRLSTNFVVMAQH